MKNSPCCFDLADSPQPQKTLPDCSGALQGVVLLVAGLTFVMVLGTPHATAGATRSVRLKWQECKPPLVISDQHDPAKEPFAR